ncbi:HPP family-domain-containing protein [Fusarium oxysporum]|nr:HPP family-domain-containing protein [Fusarium oxysporum]
MEFFCPTLTVATFFFILSILAPDFLSLLSAFIPLQTHNVSVLAGGAAVLEFYAIESPLAQPRNIFGSQLIAAAVSVSIGKLVLRSNDIHSVQWLGGAVSCTTVALLMALTKTVCPPAGATALLAVIDDQLLAIGWFLIPVLLFDCTIMFLLAILINNIQRVYPSYWWTPESLLEARADRGSQAGETRLEDDGSDAQASIRHDGYDDHESHEAILKPGASWYYQVTCF